MVTATKTLESGNTVRIDVVVSHGIATATISYTSAPQKADKMETDAYIDLLMARVGLEQIRLQ